MFQLIQSINNELPDVSLSSITTNSRLTICFGQGISVIKPSYAAHGSTSSFFTVYFVMLLEFCFAKSERSPRTVKRFKKSRSILEINTDTVKLESIAPYSS